MKWNTSLPNTHNNGVTILWVDLTMLQMLMYIMKVEKDSPAWGIKSMILKVMGEGPNLFHTGGKLELERS